MKFITGLYKFDRLIILFLLINRNYFYCWYAEFFCSYHNGSIINIDNKNIFVTYRLKMVTFYNRTTLLGSLNMPK